MQSPVYNFGQLTDDTKEDYLLTGSTEEDYLLTDSTEEDYSLTDSTEEDYTRQIVSDHVRAPFCHDVVVIYHLD